MMSELDRDSLVYRTNQALALACAGKTEEFHAATKHVLEHKAMPWKGAFLYRIVQAPSISNPIAAAAGIADAARETTSFSAHARAKMLHIVWKTRFGREFLLHQWAA